MEGLVSVLCVFLLSICSLSSAEEETSGLLVFTVATHETDGFRRFMNSASSHGYNVKVLGRGSEWNGGDVARYPGGGQKVNLLKSAMEEYKDQKDRVVMFVDSFDVVFTAGPKEVLKVFDKFNVNLLFSAEDFCWPDATLADKYPAVKPAESRFLNSGGFIGYAPEIYNILTQSGGIQDDDDDQLFYTNIFLNQREKLQIKLDTKSEIFQNMNGALDDVQLKFKGSHSYLYNVRTGNSPFVIHGNGPIKHVFNSMANYLDDRWTPVGGCMSCDQDTISLDDVQIDDYPTVQIGMFIAHPTPFLSEFFKYVSQLNYPKSKIDLFIYNSEDLHTKEVMDFMDDLGTFYNKVKLIGPKHEDMNQWKARNDAMKECVNNHCQYYLMLEGEAHLEKKDVLLDLIEYNRSIISPLLTRPEKLWSNCWGDLSSDGFYKRSPDYLDIIKKVKVGQWNVPYMSGAILIHGSRVAELTEAFINDDLDPDMAFCKTARDKGMFMYLDNQDYYGHLVDSTDMDTTHLHNDLYHIASNKYSWFKKYIHENYTATLNANYDDLVQPCPDVFWFPIVTDTFCQDLIDEMENNGDWSGGKNEDSRLQGGYENVPTDDIHTNQIGWEQHWLYFLKNYIGPLNEKAFEGYFTEARAIMNFVVRYKPTGQNRLRPHQDSSTYSINIALNTPNTDFEGGGTKFHRYDCSVTNMKKGWMLMHPGRLTHHHEGLPVTKGTRYIMVSFVDP